MTEDHEVEAAVERGLLQLELVDVAVGARRQRCEGDVSDQHVRPIGRHSRRRGRELVALGVHRERLRDRVDPGAGQVHGARLHPPRERHVREHALEGVVGRPGSPYPRCVVVAADRSAWKAGVREPLQPRQDVGERPVGGPGVVEDVAQPQEAVGLELEGPIDPPRERPKEILLAKISARPVAEVGEMGATEVRVA